MKETIKKSTNKNNIKKNNYTPTYFHRFLHTFNGLKVLWKEVNFKIELLILASLIGLGLYFNINYSGPIRNWYSSDWLQFFILTGVLGIFWLLLVAAESFNTAIELLTDLISNEQNETIRKIKDLSALGVLFIAIALVIFIAFVFWLQIA